MARLTKSRKTITGDEEFGEAETFRRGAARPIIDIKAAALPAAESGCVCTSSWKRYAEELYPRRSSYRMCFWSRLLEWM
jgi:hypothetical protein